MPRKKPPTESLALHYLRRVRGWTQEELTRSLGFKDGKLISHYENGRPMSREKLESLVAPLGHPPEAIDALLLVHSLVAPEAREPASPVALTSEERSRINRTVLSASTTLAELLRDQLLARKRKEKADAARRDAAELWDRLKACTPEVQRELVTAAPEFRSWALVLRVCEASVRAAAHKPEDALELADLALFIAERVEGEESWLPRLQGFAWAHVANARRVANDHDGADEAFVRAWTLWRAGSPAEDLVPEWRLLDLESSLRRDERRFPEAVDLLDRALAASRGNRAASGRILLNKESALEQMGDLEGALAALAEAAPLVEASGEARNLFALRFKTAKDLCHLQRYGEAATLLPQVRELAVGLGQELDLVRVVWLEARVMAGQGRRDEAVARLEQVRWEFTKRELPYDAALSTLDLAVLHLEDGRTREVKALAGEMAPIFKARGIAREALASLKLFCDAALRETATVELARRVITEIEEARRSAPRPENGRGRE
jgi:tetratricopeptide (TPR) repeat protein